MEMNCYYISIIDRNDTKVEDIFLEATTAQEAVDKIRESFLDCTVYKVRQSCFDWK